MNRGILPKSTIIDGIECEFYTDFRDILEIFEVMSDPDLLDSEKLLVSLDYFYKTDDYKINMEEAMKQMCLFLCQGEEDKTSNRTNDKPLYDWEQDFNIIIAPINRIMGTDVRGLEYLHWWTFLSAFMEIGECTFSTYVSIRDKLNRGKKLDNTEERIYRDNRDRILIKKRYDSETQSLMDEIMGRRI